MNPNAAAVVVQQYLPLQGGKPLKCTKGQGTMYKGIVYRKTFSFQLKDAGGVIDVIFRRERNLQSDGHEVGTGEGLAV